MLVALLVNLRMNIDKQFVWCCLARTLCALDQSVRRLLLAFALMSSIKNQPEGADFLSLAGPGFRDFTRIAASDPSVWRDILVSNREELLAQSKHFQRALHALEVAITSGNPDALEALIEQASSTRAQWRMTAIKPQS